jgi:hypothetical protein
MDEFLNPARKYKSFRPRQAVRALKATGTPTNNATVGLFNNSTGPYILVVRDLTILGTVSDVIAASYADAQIGTSQGKVQSMLPTAAVQNGLLASVDTATLFPGDYDLSLSTTGVWEWEHDFPFAVIEPGWSLVFQDPTVAHAITVSLVWEAIQIDQLDYFY